MPQKTLLIVDDEVLFTESLADGLSALDPTLRVVTAENGVEARAAIEREPFDLVLTDLKMPGMDGFELLAHLGKRCPGVPVLVMTAFGTPEIGERLRVFDIGDVVEKPVDFRSLTQRIARALESGASDASEHDQLTGRLGVFSPFELLQLLSDLQKVGTLELSRHDGVTARCFFVDGAVVAAECGHLRGREAVFTFLWWKQGRFVFDRRAFRGEFQERLRVPEELMEAVRLADEIERRKDVLPPRDGSLFLVDSTVGSDDRLDCGVPEVARALRDQPGLTCAQLEERLPLAPIKVRLALALLGESGQLARPRTRSQPMLRPAFAPGLQGNMWDRLMGRFPGGLRALVATCASEPSETIFRAVSRLGETLGLPDPSVSFCPDGPSFVRLRPASGGILSLTFLPVAKKHRYLFETFVRSVQVVLFSREGAAQGESAFWEAAVPPGVSVTTLGRGASLESEIARCLSQLVGEFPGSN